MNVRYVLLSAMFLLGLSVLVPCGLATDFSATNVGSSTINISATNYQINITITNMDAYYNITKVDLVLGSFTFFSGSNITSASNAIFGNSSSSAINWTNEIGLINTGETHNFVFNVTAPSEDGFYNVTVNVTDIFGNFDTINVTYSVVALFSLTFNNYTVMQQTSNTIQNLNYTITIRNNGAGAETYNLTVVNCATNLTAGVGTLNVSSINLAAGANTSVLLSVSNSTAGLYSLCIMANHWNGATMNTTWNFTSAQNGVVLNSSFLPDLAIPAIYWTSTGGANPFAGGNITVYNVTLNNTGHFNFSGSFFVYLLWDDVVVNSTVTAVNTSLGNGTSYNVSFSNITGIITGITNGPHNLSVWVDALNNVSESNENNNYYNTTVFVGYNITIIGNVIGQSGVNATTNRNVTINVSVRYANGSFVTNLGKDNFTVYDQQGGGPMITSSNAILNASFVSSMNASGIYWFNITTHIPENYTDTKPGVHNLTVSITNNENGKVYSGNNTGSPYYYLIVPRLEVILSATSSSMTEGNTKSITVSVTNTGNDPIYNVTLNTPVLESYLEIYSSYGGCTGKCYMGNNVINPGEYMNYSLGVKALDVSDIEVNSVQVTADGNHNNTGTVVTYAKTGTYFITINPTSSGTTDDNGGGGGTTARSCTSDSSCGMNETCNATKKCAAISCPNGVIEDHVCFAFTYNINITSYESLINSVSGSDKSVKVTIKNTGSNSFTAKLEVTIGSGITASVSPASYSLGGGESYQFTVNFTVSNTTTIGNFSGTFKAYVSTSTATYDSKAFSFVVLPREETKSVINASYQELLGLFANITTQFNQMKASGMYNQSVLSPLESIIQSVNSTLIEMKNAINSDDYVTAQTFVSQINASINNAQLNMDDIRETIQSVPQQYGIWFWVAVIVIIIFVAGFFIYMFYPSSRQGYHPDKGFVHPEAKGGGSIIEKIKRIFKRKKEEKPAAATTTVAKSVSKGTSEPPKDEGNYETLHYKDGYQKEKSYEYEYENKKGVKGIFQKLRRKKKKPPQMHIDQFANSSSNVIQ